MNWHTGNTLTWYKTYNDTKHDRHSKFNKATFDQLIEAVCGLLVILSAQFWKKEYSPGEKLFPFPWERTMDGFELGIGSYFGIEFPRDWPESEKYDFNWSGMMQDDDPFQNFNYT